MRFYAYIFLILQCLPAQCLLLLFDQFLNALFGHFQHGITLQTGKRLVFCCALNLNKFTGLGHHHIQVGLAV